MWLLLCSWLGAAEAADTVVSVDALDSLAQWTSDGWVASGGSARLQTPALGEEATLTQAQSWDASGRTAPAIRVGLEGVSWTTDILVFDAWLDVSGDGGTSWTPLTRLPVPGATATTFDAPVPVALRTSDLRVRLRFRGPVEERASVLLAVSQVALIDRDVQLTWPVDGTGVFVPGNVSTVTWEGPGTGVTTWDLGWRWSGSSSAWNSDLSGIPAASRSASDVLTSDALIDVRLVGNRSSGENLEAYARSVRRVFQPISAFDLISPANGAWSDATPELSWGPVSRALRYEITVDGTVIVSDLVLTTDWTQDVSYVVPDSSGIPGGAHTWSITAVDAGGRTLDSTSIRTVRIDDVGPGPFDLVGPADGDWVSRASELSWAAPASGEATGYLVYLDGNVCASLGAVTHAKLSDVTSIDGGPCEIGEGEHEWWVSAVDAVGNTSESNEIRSIRVDLRPPGSVAYWLGHLHSTSIANPDPASDPEVETGVAVTSSNELMLEASGTWCFANDGSCYAVSSECYGPDGNTADRNSSRPLTSCAFGDLAWGVDGGSAELWNCGGASSTYPINRTGELLLGANDDDAQNCWSRTLAVEAQIGATPWSPYVDGYARDIGDPTPTFVWPALDDDGSGGVWYRVMGSIVTGYFGSELCRSTTTTCTVDTPIIDAGAYGFNWLVEAHDAAGNIRRSTRVYGSIDLVPPSAATLVQPTDGTCTDLLTPDLCWQTTGEYSLAAYELYVDGVLKATLSPPPAGGNLCRSVLTTSGTHTWHVDTVDGAKNRTSSVTRTFRVAGAVEICNGIDDDCDGVVPASELDADHDGTSACAGDCDDVSSIRHPGATEICDGLDDDCVDGVPADEQDGDGDGVSVCAGDCADGDASRHPGAAEICDGIDQDCDGSVAAEVDVDADGYRLCAGDCADGDADRHPGASEVCDGLDDDCVDGVPADELDGDGDGTSACAGDCDDASPLRHPGATETCNGLDDDCVGGVPQDESDGDGDGVRVCAGDCADGDASRHPGAAEACDGVDQDCDGSVVDEVDGDGDGYRLCGGDCADGDAGRHPGAAEACNGLDDDCSGSVPAGELDGDHDGTSACAGDCDDASAARHPGATETCNGLDDDCVDGVPADELDGDADGVRVCAGDCADDDVTRHPGAREACDGVDQDCDGSTAGEVDVDADGYRPCDGDCADGDATRFPGAAEVCGDGQDGDCDGLTDSADTDCPVSDTDDTAVDTERVDTIVVDSAVSDSEPADTEPADTDVLDTTVAETGGVDSDGVVAGETDEGADDTESRPNETDDAVATDSDLAGGSDEPRPCGCASGRVPDLGLGILVLAWGRRRRARGRA